MSSTPIITTQIRLQRRESIIDLIDSADEDDKDKNEDGNDSDIDEVDSIIDDTSLRKLIRVTSNTLSKKGNDVLTED